MEQEQIIFELDDDFYVTQHNKLIVSRYDMTALEQKLMLTLISTIRKDDNEIPTTVFRVKDLASLMGVSEELLYRDLPKTCKKIMSRVIEVRQDNGDWEMFNIIPYAKYISKQGSLKLEINKKAWDYLLHLKELFSSYQLKNVLHLDSKYSIRLYQLTKSNSYKGVWTIELDEFKDILKLNKKSYDLYGNIKLKVISPALKEINEKTNLNVEVEEQKMGRKVHSLKFRISESATSPLTYSKQLSKKQTINPMKFNNFEAREYNYDELERKLLGWDKEE